jgi:hypothetical protein
MEEEKRITVRELIHEHMKFLAARATFCKEDYGPDRKPDDKKDIIAAMENLQCLMNRLNINQPEDPYVKALFEDRVFLGLSYDSKLFVMEHACMMSSLRSSIERLIHVLEEKPALRKKMCRSAGWRLFRLLSRLPWAGDKYSEICYRLYSTGS